MRRAHVFRPSGENSIERLENRELLSVVRATAASVASEQEVTTIFEKLLHHDPTTRELLRGSTLLDDGVRPLAEADRLVVSREYHADHPTATAFVDGLYSDVLGRPADASGAQFWIHELQSGAATRAEVGAEFLSAPGSFLSAPGAAAGFVTSVSATNGWATSFSGNTAGAAGFFNAGNPPTVVTITVTAAGQYVLNQSNGSFVGNSSGKSWKGFTLTLLSTSSALPTFTSSSDASGHFKTATLQPKSVSFSGGIVTSGFNSQVNGFQPVTVINATAAGTIVVQETPVNA
jgi:hypothetical protein